MTAHITVRRELLRQVLETLTCTGEDDDPGHRCACCDDYVDRNGPVRKALRTALEQPAVEPVAEASVLELADQLKAGAAFPAYPPMPLREAASVLLKQHEEIVQLREALRVSATASPPADVPLLTEEEIVAAIASAKKIPADYIGWVRDQRIEYGRSIEQAVRQKAGLK